jgi:Tfp pilus assembly protein PilN
MITINLIPQERRKQRATRPQIAVSQDLLITLAQVIAAVLVVLGVLAAVAINREVKKTLLEIKRVEQQREALKEQLEELARLKYELAVLNDKRAVIDYLGKNRIDWARKLEDLSMNLDDDIWLRMFEISHGYAGGRSARTEDQILMQCLTSNTRQANFIMSRTMAALEQSGFVNERIGVPEMIVGQRRSWMERDQEAVFNPEVWQFELRFPILPPPEPAAKVVSADKTDGQAATTKGKSGQAATGKGKKQ